MNKKLLAFALLFLCGISAASNVHVSDYRLDPTLSSQEDFSLYLTFKNDIEMPADNLKISLYCPPEFSCPNATTSMPAYGLQEIRFPIKSAASRGVYQINVSWEDGSYYYWHNNETGNNEYARQTYQMSIPIEIKDSSISNFSATTLLYTNEEGNFSVKFNASNLHDVRASIYSDCVSFSQPFFAFTSLDGNATLSSSALVNCKSGNHDVLLTIASEELSQVIQLNVDVEKRTHARISIMPESTKLSQGKDYLRLNISNTGETAEDLTVYVVGSGPVNSASVVYLGDLSSSSEALFEIQSDASGNYPLQVQATWTEGKESFSENIPVNVEIASNNLLTTLLMVGILGICAIALFLYLKK